MVKRIKIKLEIGDKELVQDGIILYRLESLIINNEGVMRIKEVIEKEVGLALTQYYDGD